MCDHHPEAVCSLCWRPQRVDPDKRTHANNVWTVQQMFRSADAWQYIGLAHLNDEDDRHTELIEG